MDIIAHRGGSGYYVENSMPAFMSAIDKGCVSDELEVFTIFPTSWYNMGPFP